MRRLLDGDTLTRREKQQLSRSAGDLLKLVPFIVIVIGVHPLNRASNRNKRLHPITLRDCTP